MSRLLAVCALISVGLLPSASQARKWTDSTGQYEIEAEQIAANATTVVLKKRNHELLAMPIDKLSTQDQEYLKSQAAAQDARGSADQAQTWTMHSGLKVRGTVVGYARKDITLQRRRGNIYVSAQRLENLPEIYRRMVPKMVAHFENTPIDDEAGLEAWIVKLQGQPRTYRIEGVLLELDGGDEYGVPFFFFSDDDLKILKPGWDRWLAAVQQREEKKQGHEAFLLQAQARAYQQDRSAKQLIAMLHLDMEAYQAGQFDLWEVLLYPGPGVSGPSLSAVVPARDSRGAAKEARKRYPGYELGPISKVSRKY
jgi:hypothetical protein